MWKEAHEKHYIYGVQIFFSPALKVPRQCPLVLLIDVCLREDEALGSKKVKILLRGLGYEQRRETETGFTAHDRK
jgi:hypothetical protein